MDIKERIDALTEQEAKAALLALINYAGETTIGYNLQEFIFRLHDNWPYALKETQK